jgi:WD40 repeat protein
MNEQRPAQASEQATQHGRTHTRLSVDEYVVALVWSPQGDALAVAGADGGVYLLNADSGPGLRRIGEHAGGALSVGFIRGGTHLVSGGQDGEVRIYDCGSDAPPRTLAVTSPWVEHITSSADGRLLALGAGRQVRLYDTDTLSLQHAFAPLPTTVAGLAFAPRGSLLAAASYGGVQLLTPSAPYRVRTLAWTGACVALAWRPDASVIVAGGQDSSVQFWRLPKGKHAAMSGYATKVRELAWNSSGRWLATGGSRSVTLWDFKSGPEGHLPQVLHGHDDLIVGIRWQRRGPLLASISRDGALLLWQPRHSELPLKYYQLAFVPTALAWSPDDRLLALAGDGGQLAVIDTRNIKV